MYFSILVSKSGPDADQQETNRHSRYSNVICIRYFKLSKSKQVAPVFGAAADFDFNHHFGGTTSQQLDRTSKEKTGNFLLHQTLSFQPRTLTHQISSSPFPQQQLFLPNLFVEVNQFSSNPDSRNSNKSQSWATPRKIGLPLTRSVLLRYVFIHRPVYQ